VKRWLIIFALGTACACSVASVQTAEMRPENPKPTTCAPAPNFLAAGVGYDATDPVDQNATVALGAMWQPLQDSIILCAAKDCFANDQVSYQAVGAAGWDFDNYYGTLRTYRAWKLSPDPHNAQDFTVVIPKMTAQAQADTVILQGIVTKYTGASN